MPVPDTYNPVMPYLVLKNAGDFLHFMKVVFNATEQLIVPGEHGHIKHGEIRVGEATIMFADASNEEAIVTCGVCLLTPYIEEIYYRALDYGCVSVQALEHRDYGWSAGFRDHFGNTWWLLETTVTSRVS